MPYAKRWLAFERDRSKKAVIIDFNAYRRAAYDTWGGCADNCDHQEDQDMLLKRNGKTGERKALALSGFKMLDTEAGTFEGHAAAFNNIDSHGDIILPGAFKKTIEALKVSGKMLPILWQHDPEKPIGVCDPADMYEDEHGLKVKGQLVLGVQQADEARVLMQAGALGGLSIGYDIAPGGKKAPPRGSQAKRVLADLELWEFSPVTWPSNTRADIGEVKAAGDAKSADFATILTLDEKRDDLWRRKWRLSDALSEANDLATLDETMTRDQKVAAIAGNLAQYGAAMLTWFSDYLDMREVATAAGLKFGDAPTETKGDRPDSHKAGRTISAATQKKIDAALVSMRTATDELTTLVAHAAPEEDADGGDTTKPTKGAGPTPADNPDGQGSWKTSVVQLDRMREADSLARMKAAQ